MTFKEFFKDKKQPPDTRIILKALGNPVRKHMLEVFCHNRREISIEHIQQIANMHYRSVYQHLLIMEKAGLITSFKDRGEKFYEVNPEAMMALHRWTMILTNHLHNRDAHNQGSDYRYNLGNTQQISRHGRKEDWYRQGDV